MKTSVIDVPRTHKGDDDEIHGDPLGLCRYEKALADFIRGAGTPITIALQGEWGSGKTSLMNKLRVDLVETKSPAFHGVWINTWHYALLGNPEKSIIEILLGITAQIASVIEHDSNKTLLGKIGPLVSKIFKVGALTTLGVVAGGKVAEITAQNFNLDVAKDSDIAILKNAISELIKAAKGATNRGFLFFIDDLDRIDPPVAVQILELLKNIFDLEDCIFVLALDYDVVVKGLKPKFGELTEKNEREFRSFFDKIIQLPFAMPVGSYKIDTFLIDTLTSIGYLTDKDKKADELCVLFSEIARLSVGSNPRGLKRLANILSLLSLINQGEQGDVVSSGAEKKLDKIVNFALVCVQISYPRIYNILLNLPDFKAWTPLLLGVEAMPEEESKQLSQTEEFDEPWEQSLYQFCRNDYYLRNRASDLAKLLNRIADLAGEKAVDVIQRNICLSAVTSIQTSVDAATTKPEPFHQSYWLKRHRDALLPVLSPLLEDACALACRQSRIQSRISYELDIDNVFDRAGLFFELGTTDKCYTTKFRFCFHVFLGRTTESIESELKALGKDENYLEAFKNRLQEWSSDQMCITHSLSLNGGWIELATTATTLEEMVCPESIRSYAAVLANILRFYVTDIRPLMYAKNYISFAKLRDMYRKGAPPFKRVVVWENTNLVFDGFEYKDSDFKIHAGIEPTGWRLSFSDQRKKNYELLEKVKIFAHIDEAFPTPLNDTTSGDTGSHIATDKIYEFMDSVLKKLQAVYWKTVDL